MTPAAPGPESADADVPLPAQGRPVLVLIVDDNAAKRLALKAVLSPLGYTTVEADSCVAALRCISVQNFAVILLDVCMPETDGFQTAALIRKRQQSEMTPIIFFTAFSSDEIPSADRYAEGAVDFIFAPVAPEEIRAKVAAFANLYLQADELATRALEVQADRDQLTSLTDAAPIAIFRIDAEKRYVYTNPRWAEIFGISSEQAVGTTWDDNVDLERVAGPVHEPADGTPVQAELRQRFKLRVPGAPERTVLVASRPVSDGVGGVSGWVGTVDDVSAEALVEATISDARDKANEASRLKSDFLANMSHEIRTPMNGVIGMTDLLLATDLNVVQRDYAQTVRNSGEALLTIIDDILDFSKVEAGKVDIENVEFSIQRIVRDVVDLLAASAQSKGLELAAFIENSLPPVVTGDPGRTRQVLTNLIGNAIKFTASGEILVRVTTDNVGGAGTVVRFEVTDTGAGIEPEKLTSIFQPFVQADTSTSRRYGGTGLGLAISKRLVDLMGGDCGVSSDLGAGSTFWFTICVVADVEPAAGLRPSDAGLAVADVVVSSLPAMPSGAAEPATARLLLAEDNPINQQVAIAMLTGSGYTVDTVSTGSAALEAVAARHYDAILMDCQMPELSGYEATAAIRVQEGTERHTPIIALTAGARPEDRERCLAAGMDSYLSKPLRMDVLLALVATTVKNGPTATKAPQPGHPSAAEIMIDRDVLDELSVLGDVRDPDFRANLIAQFVRETEPRLLELRHAVGAGDALSAGRIAHIIQGSSSQLGGRRLALSCGRLETSARARSLSVEKDLKGVEFDYQELRGRLTQLAADTDEQAAPCLHA